MRYYNVVWARRHDHEDVYWFTRDPTDGLQVCTNVPEDELVERIQNVINENGMIVIEYIMEVK